MHLYKTMKNFLMDFDYYIDIFEQKIHIFNYVDILKLNDTEIQLLMPEFTLIITGSNFSVKQLEKREILLEGILENMRFKKND